jgi:putative FmdB family regulatory protein
VPLYEYECQACHHRFEQIQKFSDPIARKCPKCGRKKLQKLLSSSAVQFKGSGWYITDYQRKGSSSTLPDRDRSEKSDKAGKGEKDAGTKSSADTKPGKKG